MQPSPDTLPVTSLLDVNFILINKMVVLSVTLIFFCVMMLLKRSRNEAPGRLITIPINLSLLGFVLLYAEQSLVGTTKYHAVVEGIQTVIVLLCLAKFFIYLILDVYLPFHNRREPPTFLKDTIRLVVYLLIGVISLRVVFNVNLSAVVTTTTVLTAMIAFALQNSLTNALSGFAIQNENLLARHNWIAIKEKNLFGEIINVGFRYTTLRLLDNSRVLLPNSIIIQNAITIFGNAEDSDRPAQQLDIMLDYTMPPEEAKELLVTVLRNEPKVLTDPEPVVRLFSMADSAVVYQLKYWIADPGQKVPIADLIYTQVWYAVHRSGHSFPYPHRQIISTEPKAPFQFPRSLVLHELRQVDLFAAIEPDRLADLAEDAFIRIFGPGEIVVYQGEAGSSLFVVLKGQLDVLVDNSRVGTLVEDSFFGEMSLLTGEPRRATVRANREVWLAEITKELMEPLIRTTPEIMEQLSEILEQRERHNKLSVQDSEEAVVASSLRDDYLRKLKNFFRL